MFGLRAPGDDPSDLRVGSAARRHALLSQLYGRGARFRYTLHRAGIPADLRTAKILQHLGIQDVSDEQIDAALDEE